MKKNLLNKTSKLTNYSLAASALLVSNQMDAQVVHQVFNPEPSITPGNPAGFDFNDDAQADFGFLIDVNETSPDNYTTNQIVRAFALGAVDSDGGAVGSGYFANPLECGTSVSNESALGGGILAYNVNQFSTITYQWTTPSSGGPFRGLSNKYVGIKVELTGSGNIHYGWAKISVSSNSSIITLHELALNLTVGQEIDICQTSGGGNVGLENASLDDKVTIKSTLNEAIINVTPDLIGGTVEIVSLSGQVVKTYTISDVDNSFSFDGISEGIYTIAAKFNSGLVTKRIYVK